MKELLSSARVEILQLRRQNEILSAKVQVLDLVGALLFTSVQNTQGYAPDVAWALEKEIERLNRQEKTQDSNEKTVEEAEREADTDRRTAPYKQP